MDIVIKIKKDINTFNENSLAKSNEIYLIKMYSNNAYDFSITEFYFAI